MLALNLLFGVFGLAYFVYDIKNGASLPLMGGVDLMVLPYFISGLFALILVGLILFPRFHQGLSGSISLPAVANSVAGPGTPWMSPGPVTR